MADYYEIDFLAVETKKSGDAIGLRYELHGTTTIHVVDGGYQDTGTSLVEHIKAHYGNPARIDHVVLTHPDGDHASGLVAVLESFEVGALWMHRPWTHAAELIGRFETYKSVEALRQRLRNVYPNVTRLEEVAQERAIPIREPFQGTRIGAFTVLAPSYARYLDLIVSSEKTPESADSGAAKGLMQLFQEAGVKLKALVKGLWGHEVFSPNETSAENEMSVVQVTQLNGHKLVLTGDVGRAGLTEAADYAPHAGIALPGIDRFQVPHHGSRRNVSTETLDRWLGERLSQPLPDGEGKFFALVSSAKEDEDHPRNSVVRAMIHRGGRVYCTEGKSLRISQGAPDRAGWSAATAATYPPEQEE